MPSHNTKEHIKERLILQQLNASHIAQFHQLLRYAFQVTNSDLHEFGWDNDEIQRSKKPILEHAQVLGWFDRGTLVSQIALYPMQMNIYNKIYAMGGITGVATYPEYSGLGLMTELMREALERMRDRGQSIACLYPYSIPYYRARGFEIISDKMSFTLKDTQCPNPKHSPGMMQRVHENHPDLLALHDAFARQTHGCLVRDALSWEEYWRWDVEDTVVAIYYDESEKPSGYIVYLLENDVFKIKEMIALSEEARAGLWGYVYAHKSMFDSIEGNNFSNHSLAFLLEDGHIKESIQPYIMARIVDVAQFLRDFPFDSITYEARLCLCVKDELLAWNHAMFVLEFFAHGVQVSIEPYPQNKHSSQALLESSASHIIYLSIQTLSAMLLGYKRPLYLREIRRLRASDEAIDVLEDVLPEGKAYFSDYF